MKVFHISIFIVVLISGCLFFLADEIIITLLGAKWQPSVLIFQILVFRIIFSPFGSLISKSLLAKGFSKENFKIGQIRRFVLLLPIMMG
jgi:O-antigen/teichoic acid export membrane protein